MKMVTIEIEDKVDELIAILDGDIRQMQESLSRLNELRGLLVKHDDATLSTLLEGIRSEQRSYKCNELKRQLIREELAITLGCSPKQITLSTLEAELSGEKREQVAERKGKLRFLADRLKAEHLSTMLLLSDCARFNNALLKGVFELGKTGTITYDSKGSAQNQNNRRLVNLRF